MATRIYVFPSFGVALTREPRESDAESEDDGPLTTDPDHEGGEAA
jgi:hypothetical protein